MIYSVWVPEARRYDYYSVGEAIEDDTPAPSFSSGPSKLGYAPGEASWDLPAGAKPIGQGQRARGVVVHPQAVGDLDLGSKPIKWLLYVGIAFAAWKVFK